MLKSAGTIEGWTVKICWYPHPQRCREHGEQAVIFSWDLRTVKIKKPQHINNSNSSNFNNCSYSFLKVRACEEAWKEIPTPTKTGLRSKNCRVAIQDLRTTLIMNQFLLTMFTKVLVLLFNRHLLWALGAAFRSARATKQCLPLWLVNKEHSIVLIIPALAWQRCKRHALLPQHITTTKPSYSNWRQAWSSKTQCWTEKDSVLQ